jgi:hypothetical protein
VRGRVIENEEVVIANQAKEARQEQVMVRLMATGVRRMIELVAQCKVEEQKHSVGRDNRAKKKKK